MAQRVGGTRVMAGPHGPGLGGSRSPSVPHLGLTPASPVGIIHAPSASGLARPCRASPAAASPCTVKGRRAGAARSGLGMPLAFPGGCPQRHVPSGTGAAPALSPQPGDLAPMGIGMGDRALSAPGRRETLRPAPRTGKLRGRALSKHPWCHQRGRGPRPPAWHSLRSGCSPRRAAGAWIWSLFVTRSCCHPAPAATLCVPRAEAIEGTPNTTLQRAGSSVPIAAPIALLPAAQPPPEPGLPLSPSIPN